MACVERLDWTISYDDEDHRGHELGSGDRLDGWNLMGTLLYPEGMQNDIVSVSLTIFHYRRPRTC